MKAFWKWDDEYRKLADKLYTSAGMDGRYLAWRAALEWATSEGYWQTDEGLDVACKERQQACPEAYIEFIDANRIRDELNS